MKKKKPIPKQLEDRSVRYRWIWWALLAAAVFLSISLRWSLLDVPLERDEGEYAYGGQLLLQGMLPYQHLYSMKLPGIYAVYAGLLALFGQTHTGIHLGLLVVNIATIIVLFLLGRKLFDPLAGAVAGAIFAVLSVSQSVQGVFANAEHFVILPAVAGLLLLLRGLDDDRPWSLFWGGLLLGIGFVVKQHGAAFVVLGALYLIIDRLRVRPVEPRHVLSECALFGAGAVLPYALICVIMASAGIFEKFWFWTVEYARAYTSQMTIPRAWALFKVSTTSIVTSAPLLWMLVLGGLITLFRDKRLWRRWLFTLLFILFSLAALCPGFYFRPHYFLLALPAAALIAGGAISGMARKLSAVPLKMGRYALPIGLVVICLTASVYQQRSFLFLMTPLQACRATYGSNPFPESLEIARYIRAHTQPGDRIAVIGS
ncbi:MAG: glycosyltransferase family 39 protein, partial [Syntrophaceae bacterium]|nr:glycosyltransferase family 39 protein [Syntrophaceae bacterium]